MSDIIQLLPDSVANQIAAGEVIQRPASVVKELVENAVDAGAKHIHVLIEDAGRTSIQVIDDGKGMSETDARLSFERHSTSKIRKAEDLFSLHTMGFRGEALASIAAVAQVELLTRQANEEVGTRLCISGSRFQGQEPCSCPVGSNFRVGNLFYNVPARRKFLKSNTTEMNNILTAFERIALVYPDIMFTLRNNGTELLHLPADNLMKRIVDMFGKKLSQDLLPVGVETAMCKLTGFVGKPESARKKCPHQYFFVNGRYMKHPYFHKAVISAFDRLVPVGEQVPYFLYFEVPAEDIDVNIHPTKTEIKFENEQAIWQIVQASVKEAVGLFNDVPSIDFDSEGKPEIPIFDSEPGNVRIPHIEVDPSYNPFKPTAKSTAKAPASSMRSSKMNMDWEKLYEGIREEDEKETDLFDDSTVVTTSHEMLQEKSPAHYQYKGRYLMTAVKSGLMIIDQHRAHVRILYERYLKQTQEKTWHSQRVLFPEVVQFSASERVVLEKIMPELRAVGFDLSDLGSGSYAVNAIPAGLEGIDVSRLACDIVSTAIEKGVSATDEINRMLALSLARDAAIPYGQVLGNEEMESIVNNLFQCSTVNYTPDGKNILCILKQEEIEHLLG